MSTSTKTLPKIKHSYDEDAYDDEGNRLGKQMVHCVDGKLAVDFDRDYDGSLYPIWFNIINTDDPASCRVCSGEVRPGYAPPASVSVKMSYLVAKTILDNMQQGIIKGWEHDNEDRCKEDPDTAKNCSLCIVGNWLDSVLQPAIAERPIKKSKKKVRQR